MSILKGDLVKPMMTVVHEYVVCHDFPGHLKDCLRDFMLATIVSKQVPFTYLRAQRRYHSCTCSLK